MAYFRPASGLLGLATKVGGAAMSLSFIADVAGNGGQVVEALSDNITLASSDDTPLETNFSYSLEDNESNFSESSITFLDFCSNSLS